MRKLGFQLGSGGGRTTSVLFPLPTLLLFRHQEKWCLLLSSQTLSLPGRNLSYTEGLPRLAEPPLQQSPPQHVRSLHAPQKSDPPQSRPVWNHTAQWGALADTAPGSDDPDRESFTTSQALSPGSFTLFLTAPLGRMTDEEMVLFGSQGGQVVEAGPGLGPL